LEDLLRRIEFSEVEIDMALFELDQFRSIHCTSTDKYPRSALSSIGDEGRSAFLKGFLVGAFLTGQN
jgi:hypothetical protein